MKRGAFLAAIFAAAVSVPTAALAYMGYQGLVAEEADRRQRVQARQGRALQSVTEKMRQALAELGRDERRRPWSDSFLLLDDPSADPGSVGAGAAHPWPAYTLDRIRVTEAEGVKGRDRSPVPELAGEFQLQLEQAQQVAELAEAAFGVGLRQMREQAAAADSWPGEYGSRSPRALIEELLGRVSGPDGEVDPVPLRMGEVSFMAREHEDRRLMVVFRPVRASGRPAFLSGAVVDLDRLWHGATDQERLEDGDLFLISPEEQATRPGMRVTMTAEVDTRRLPGWSIVVRESSPDAVTIAARSAMLRFVWMTVILGLAVIACLFTMLRLVMMETELARERADFVAAVTHELRTPLTAIRMFGELLAEGPAGQQLPARRHVDHILTETARLERLVENVLEHAIGSQRSRQLLLEDADLGESIEAVVESRREGLERIGFEIEVEIEPGLPPIPHDALAFERILGNLLDNAGKYGVGGGVRVIEIGLRRAEGEFQLTVADRGVGLEAGEVDRVFSRFARGRRARYARAPGVGLGLSNVKMLVDAHRWSVRAANREGGGAIFTVTISAS